MTTALQIHKEHKTLEERGLPHDSFWHVVFVDGSERDEKDTSWAAISDRVEVEYLGGQKTVHLLKFPVKHISVSHGDLKAEIEVPEGVQVYQAIRGETMLNGQGKNSQVLGRIIGLVKDGSVIEERFINVMEGRVMGMRK